MSIEQQAPALANIEEDVYGWVGNWIENWKYRLYATDAGLARLSTIAGYLIGLKHGGQPELAEQMAQDFNRNLDRLTQMGQNCDITTGEGENETTCVPSCKVALHDDGCFHSFSFVLYRPLAPAAYQACYDKHDKQLQAEGEESPRFETIHTRVVQELKIREKMNPSDKHSSELTEYRYVNDRRYRIFYVMSYHGGLIYHGPGAGQTFTVSLASHESRNFWGIHT
jgi:hypothetical protein